MSRLEDLRDLLDSREARVGVVGLGYVGLPLAVELAKAGFRVTGFDLDEGVALLAIEPITPNHGGMPVVIDLHDLRSTQRPGDRRLVIRDNHGAAEMIQPA